MEFADPDCHQQTKITVTIRPPAAFANEISLMLGAFLGKITPENSPIPLNPLFPEDSANSEDLAHELDEFFRLMILNDLSEEEEEEKSILTEDEEPISATDLFAALVMILMTSSLMMILTTITSSIRQPSKVFPFCSRSEVRFFLASPTRHFPKTLIIEIAV